MASIGHIAVGMAATKLFRRGRHARWPLTAAMAAWSCLSLLPDLDVVGFHFGVRYAARWGHRGATHSFVFALGVAAVTCVVARRFRLDALRTFAFAAAVVASHAVLDTMTDGGLGCALLWPFDPRRYFAPWRPIPVAPIGQRFFSERGLSVALTELVFFAPLFLYALWPRRGAHDADRHSRRRAR